MNQKSKWSFGVLLIAVAVSGADSAGKNAAALEQRLIVNRVDHGRQEVERKGDELVRNANMKLASGEYMAACSLYRVAKLEFKKFNSPYFSRKMEFCDRQISRCYYLQAEDAIREADRSYQRGDFETAIKLCKEALKYCPEQADRLEALIDQYEKRKNHAAERDSVSAERLVPNRKNQEYQIEVLLEQGRKLVAANELGAAIRKYQEIMLIDPYNAAAVKSLEGVYTRIGKIGDARYNATHRRMLSEAEWKFAAPVFPESDGKGNSVNFLSGNAKTKQSVGSSALAQKLNSIVIKEFSFDDIPISVVVNHLRELTKQHDPAHLGVNFVYLPKNVVRLEAKPIEGATQTAGGGEGGAPAPAPAPAAAPAAAPVAAVAEGEGGADGAGADANQPAPEKTVSFSLKDATAMEVLRKFKAQYGIKYKIADNYVIIAPEHVSLGDMESRVFNVEITDFDSDEALKNSLIDAGISYGPGTRLTYDRQIGCVFATNTVDNLDKTEKFLEEEYNRAEPMIQVMLKIIELSQKDINELAFNWQYSVNANRPTVNPDGSLRTQTVIQENSNALLRYYRADDANPEIAGAVPDSTLNYVWQDSSGTKLVASMFALNWADSGDVLYSPRVTVRNNQVGTVYMGTVRYFPEDWEVAESTISDTYMTESSPQPTFSDDPEYLGLKVSFQPQILDDSRVIQVKVEFPINTFVNWMVFDARKDGDDGEYFKMPIFNKRSVNTMVQVYDGDTVLVGGVATDLTKTYHDKIPILGDIPFIGRFFQSRYSQAEKGNMLIFLSCKIVNPDGSAKYPESKRPNGVVNFGQNL
ncbi:MAG: hypothetical protein IKA32_01370 [Lentisphaeria bacterium]|nr:hypothetical protein [Lentisphaeria bacterium]